MSYRDPSTIDQIQPKWPLNFSVSHGPYQSVDTPEESLRQDLIFLLLTIPGEWPMDPELGVGLAKYLFENYNSSDISQIKSNIESQLKIYLPNIQVLKAEFSDSAADQEAHTSILKILFYAPDLDYEDEINFGLNQIEKSLVVVDHQSTYQKVGRL